MSGLLEELLVLGVPQEFLSQPRIALEGDQGILHSLHGGCSPTHQGFAPARYIILTEIPPGQGCRCLLSADGDANPRWRLVGALAQALSVLQDRVPDPSALGVRAHYREVCKLQDMCLFYIVTGNEPLFMDALQELEIQLGIRQAVVLHTLRSAEVQEEIHTLQGGPLPGPDMLVGLRGMPLKHQRNDMIDTILLSYGTERDGSTSAVLPRRLATVVREWAMAYRHQPGVEISHVTLRVEDTPEILETAQVLWSPGGEGDLTHVRHALEAARELT